MDHSNGLIAAYVLDGQGGGKSLGWDGIRDWCEGDGTLWVHLNYSSAGAVRWLEQDSGLDPTSISALMNDDPRPRSVVTHDQLLVTLRGVNLNPGADPEDMVSIRLWVSDKCIISTRKRKLLSVNDLRVSIDQGRGPTSSGEFLADLSFLLVERMADVVNGLDHQADLLEEQVLSVQSHHLRPKISELRRETINLRRYLAPQREAMSRLYNERVPWLGETTRMRLREIADSTMRYVEDLDAARERAIVIQEELLSRISEQMDKRMYVLSLVAAIFLPLGFLTGLLGINLGGIPGVEHDGAFLIFCLILLVVLIVQVLLFRKMKWI